MRRSVRSGNPYHDPTNGRFTNKPGAGASGGGVLRRVAAAGDYRTGKGTRRDGNTVSKTRGSTISADVRTRGNTARNVSADEAMRGTPRAYDGGGVLTSRDGSRRSMSTDPWGGLAKSIGGPRGRIGKTAADNRENMMQTARRAGRESEKGERLSASEWARKSREATNRQRDDYEADEKARSESQKLLKMAQQQTNMRARAAEFADRDMERRRERAAKSRSTESILEERYGSATATQQPWEKRIEARTEDNRRKREAKAAPAKRASGSDEPFSETTRGAPMTPQLEREIMARAEENRAARMRRGDTERRNREKAAFDAEQDRLRRKREAVSAKKSDIEAIRGGKDPYRDAVNARDSKMGTRRSVSDRERTAGGFYEEIVRNGQPIPRPSGDRLDSMVRDYELLNKSSALTAIRDLAESGDEGAAKYYEQAKAVRSAESDLSKIAKASAGKIVFGHIS